MINGGIQICFILGRCRTGSTTITRAIASHKNAAAYSEILNPTNPDSYQCYFADILRHEPSAKDDFLKNGPLFAFEDYIKSLIERSIKLKPELHLFAFECKIENAYVFSENWTHPSRDFNSISLIRRSLNISNSVIFLRRRNVFERFLSDIAARSTGVFHSDEGQQISVSKQVVQVKDLVRQLKDEVDFDHKMFAYIRGNFASSSLFDYEDTYCPDGFTERFLQRFYQVSKGLRLEQTAQKKVRVLTAPEFIQNYEEVAIAIKDAPALAWMLGER